MRKIKLVSILVIVFFLGLSLYYWRLQRVKVENWENNISAFENAESYDKEVRTVFLDTLSYVPRERFKKLFEYFFRGYQKYKSKNGALVYYPGEFSGGGQSINALEGFARFFPLGCSYIFNTQNAPMQMEGESINVAELFRKAILEGANPISKEYWGAIGSRDQKMAEAADIALGLWISKEFIWDMFDEGEKKQIYTWLMQIRGKKHGDNNWNLFPVMVVKSLEALGMAEPKDVEVANKKFERYIKKDYLGKGWFKDGEAPPDYYNAWAIQYCLFWLNQMHPDFHSEFICKSNANFSEFFKHFFGPKGFPMMGRSVCYRMALPSPIISSSLLNEEVVSSGEALRALDYTWSHFISNEALYAGKVTQGFYKRDLGVLDRYSGAGSCLWSLRSLIMAFYVDSKINLYDAVPKALPIEERDFELENTSIGWVVRGEKATGLITLEILSNSAKPTLELKPYSSWDAFLETLWQYPHRPNNKKALYENRFYTNENTLFLNTR
ncbi:DUF2264 domain-containing protein [Zobellia uliginosa]|uniref:DUF2264 domain-containing protein n=1 Tax=Zobellia uliginosa TaxID=143224 RepID=UPI0026E3DB50|nr:DUF2264 domain-containing protein [Zobellia uliginosa]MDO6518269.1 DUF2264 domain-containing protein [Zobellia uliginosa]